MRKFLVCALLVSMAVAPFVSCAGAQGHSLKLSDGTTVRWTPPDPKIGDLVRLEVMAAAAASPSGTGVVAPAVTGAGQTEPAGSVGPVRDPSGSAIESRAADFSQGTKKIRWSFRVTAAGTWTIDAGEKRQMLWNVVTVSGKSTELKKFDGESLWHGTKPKLLPSGAAQPAQAVSP